MRACFLLSFLAFTLAGCPEEPVDTDATDVAAEIADTLTDNAEDVADSGTDTTDLGPDPDVTVEVDASDIADIADIADLPDNEETVDAPDTADAADVDDSGDAAHASDDGTGSDLDAGPEADADTAEVTPECQSPCDCPQGQACTNGSCVLEANPVFCCSQDDCPAGSACTDDGDTTGICGSTPSPAAGALVFNEVLSDGEVDGDPNGDADPSDPVGDEFVEIVNASDTAIAMDGFTLEETTFVGLPRHTFAAGTTLEPGSAIVIFGGGTAPDDISGARFEVANAADVGIAFGLALDDEGDTLTLRDASGALVAVFAYGPGTALPAVSDRSYTRSPDTTGDFVAHDDAQPPVLYSPGMQADGTNF